MRVPRRALLAGATAGVVPAIAGCLTGGDSDATEPEDTELDATDSEPGDDTTENDPTTEDDPTTDDDSGTTTDASRATVRVGSHDDHGEILVDSEGMTLYMFDQDTQDAGASACQDSCASNWPPLTVDGDATAGDGVAADLSTFEREDGSMQVAGNGWPLYYYAGDSSPGDATGQGAGGVWWVLDPDGVPVKPDDDGTTTGGDGTTTGGDDGTTTDGPGGGGYRVRPR